jgi:hypothetical protein
MVNVRLSELHSARTSHTRRYRDAWGVYYIVAPAAGSHDLVVNYRSSSGTTIGYECFTGVNQTTPIDTHNIDNTSSYPTSDVNSITTQNSNEWLTGVWFSESDNSSWTGSAGTTDRVYWDAPGPYHIIVFSDSNGAKSSPGTYGLGWQTSGSGSLYQSIVVGINPAIPPTTS